MRLSQTKDASQCAEVVLRCLPKNFWSSHHSRYQPLGTHMLLWECIRDVWSLGANRCLPLPKVRLPPEEFQVYISVWLFTSCGSHNVPAIALLW